MGSYGMLAKRAVETEMPVMVQVFRPKPQLGFVFPEIFFPFLLLQFACF